MLLHISIYVVFLEEVYLHYDNIMISTPIFDIAVIFKLNIYFLMFSVLVPTALSIEEQRLLESLDRLNERLKSKSADVITMI